MSEIADWLYANQRRFIDHRGRRFDQDFTFCAFPLLLCLAPPVYCGIEPGWPHLKRLLPIVERAIRELGSDATLYLGVLALLKRGGFDLLPDPALNWLHEIVQARKADQEFWQANGESTVELLKQVIGQKGHDLTSDHRQAVILMADILVDNGVRGAGFLQQELMRPA